MEPSFHHMNKNKQMCTHTHTGTNSTATVCCQSLSAESTELRTSIPCDCLQHVLLLAPLWPCLKGSPAGKDCFCLQWDCRDYNMCASAREGVCMRPLRLAFDGSKTCDTHSPSLLFCLSFFTLFSVSLPFSLSVSTCIFAPQWCRPAAGICSCIKDDEPQSASFYSTPCIISQMHFTRIMMRASCVTGYKYYRSNYG